MPHSYGLTVHVGKVYDTKENVERELASKRIGFYVEQNQSGQLMYTLYDGRPAMRRKGV
jgi:hypothetical protein